MAMMHSYQTFLLVALLPIITRAQYFGLEPDNADVIQGDDVVLSCSILGMYSAQVFWRTPANSDRLVGPDYTVPPDFTDEYEITGEPFRKEYNLRIKQANVNHEGGYSCVLIWSNGLEISSRVAQINVVEITPDGAPGCLAVGGRTITEGEERELFCGSQDTNVELRWQRAGLDLSRKVETSPFAANAISSTLIAHMLDHEQEYACVALNTGLPVCTVKLIVRYKPRVTLESTGASVTDRDGQYDCTADGFPDAFAYTWYYNDYEVQYVEHPRFNRVRLENNGARMVLPSLSTSDDGAAIRCEVLNEVGVGSATFNVTITSSKSLAQIIGPILLGIILAVVAVMLFFYYCWWRHQQGRLKRIIKKRLPAPRTTSTIPTITGLGPAMRMNSQYVIPRSGLDLEGVGYGPDTNMGYSPDEDAFGPQGPIDDDDGAIRPIPRKKSTSSSLGQRPEDESDEDEEDYERDVNLDADDDETNKVYTYHVNPNFPQLKPKGHGANSYDMHEESNGSNGIALDFMDGPDTGPGGEMLSTEL